MRVVFRVDASIQIGSGHVMRCLTLAQKLRSRSVQAVFICREMPGHLCDLVEEQGFSVIRLPYRGESETTTDSYENWLGVTSDEDAEQTLRYVKETRPDWLIVDHYALDESWEKQMRPFIRKLMVIDDLADRAHDCDLLLDQNLYEGMENRYTGLVPAHCLLMLGPRYALLREEFLAAGQYAKVRSGTVKTIFVFFGGSDPTGETEKALGALALLNRTNVEIDVVVGRSNPNNDRIEALCASMPGTRFHCQTPRMAELMVKADLAIGAGGTTTWERCAMGLPALTVTTADNQLAVTEAVARTGAIVYLGHYRDVSAHSIANSLRQLLQEPMLLNEMSRKGMKLMSDLRAGSAHIVDILVQQEGAN